MGTIFKTVCVWLLNTKLGFYRFKGQIDLQGFTFSYVMASVGTLIQSFPPHNEISHNSKDIYISRIYFLLNILSTNYIIINILSI